MKNTILHTFWPHCLILIGIGLLANPSTAQPSDDFRQAFLDNISLEVTTLAKEHVGTVIQAPIRKVKFEAFAGHSDSPSYGRITVFESDGQLVPVEVPATTQPLPYFDKLCHPDFSLTEESASAFLDMLKAIMPDSFFDTFEGQRIRQSDGQFQFLTGEFFDDLKGFVVSVDEGGHITSVSYSLEL